MTLKKVIIYDDTAEWYLRAAWKSGSLLANKVIAAKSWEDAIDELYELTSDGSYLDVQTWTHGNDGKIFINGKQFPFSKADKLKGYLFRLWARSCETMRGEAGHDFAREFTIRLDAELVGHCVVTSAPNPLVQGKICALKPKEGVWWSLTGHELFNCSTLRMTVPKFAYKSEWERLNKK